MEFGDVFTCFIFFSCTPIFLLRPQKKHTTATTTLPFYLHCRGILREGRFEYLHFQFKCAFLFWNRVWFQASILSQNCKVEMYGEPRTDRCECQVFEKTRNFLAKKLFWMFMYKVCYIWPLVVVECLNSHWSKQAPSFSKMVNYYFFSIKWQSAISNVIVLSSIFNNIFSSSVCLAILSCLKINLRHFKALL